MWATQTSIIANTKIHYRRNPQNADKPPLVMLHGITDNGACFMRVADALADEFDPVMVDLPGHGASGAPSEGYTPESFADSVLGLVAALGLYRPVLIGHSMGAEIAALVAIDAPELIQGIIMEDPPFRAQPLSDKKITAMCNWWENLIRERRAKKLDALVVEAQQRHWHDLDAQHWATSKRQVFPEIVAYIRTQNQHDWRHTLQQIACPTLVLTGDSVNQSAIITPEVAEEIAQLLPNSTIIHVPNASHSIRRDQFDLYLDAVRMFLKKL